MLSLLYICFTKLRIKYCSFELKNIFHVSVYMLSFSVECVEQVYIPLLENYSNSSTKYRREKRNKCTESEKGKKDHQERLKNDSDSEEAPF